MTDIHVSDICTGDTILIHTKYGILPRAVQRFQSKEDKESGYYNHSGKAWVELGVEPEILEAAPKDWDENKGKLIRAGLYFNPLRNYLDPDKYEILILKPVIPYDRPEILEIMKKWEGTPYEMHNLLGDQIIQYIFGWWWGRDEKIAHKLMVCHEGTMKIDNDYSGGRLFENWHRGMIKDIYHEPMFTRHRLIIPKKAA